MKYPVSLTKLKSFKEIVPFYQAFIFDINGVFVGNDPIPHSLDALQYLQMMNKKIFFLTNNSRVSRKDVKQKLINFGFKAVEQQIYCSSFIAANYLKKSIPPNSKIYALGSGGLMEELTRGGFEVVAHEGNSTSSAISSQNDFTQIQVDKDIKAVVVGFDYFVNYYKLAYASLCIQNGAAFIATNDDTHTMANGKKMPASGPFVQALKLSCGVSPLTTGKPNPMAVEAICEDFGLEKKSCLIIGDGLKSDIALGVNSKINSLLVLTGNTKEQDLLRSIDKNTNIIPTYYVDNLS